MGVSVFRHSCGVVPGEEDSCGPSLASAKDVRMSCLNVHIHLSRSTRRLTRSNVLDPLDSMYLAPPAVSPDQACSRHLRPEVRTRTDPRMFGCGTGIVVVSIKEIRYEEADHILPYSPIVLSIRDTLTSLHRGKKEWKDWVYTVPEWSGVEKQKEVEGEDAYAYI